LQRSLITSRVESPDPSSPRSPKSEVVQPIESKSLVKRGADTRRGISKFRVSQTEVLKSPQVVGRKSEGMADMGGKMWFSSHTQLDNSERTMVLDRLLLVSAIAAMSLRSYGILSPIPSMHDEHAPVPWVTIVIGLASKYDLQARNQSHCKR
jgi:hypothetical protein